MINVKKCHECFQCFSYGIAIVIIMICYAPIIKANVAKVKLVFNCFYVTKKTIKFTTLRTLFLNHK